LSLEALEPRQLLSASRISPAHHVFHPLAGSASSAGYTPAQIRTAYGFTGVSANGAGQTIAIIDAYNDPNIQSDLATFDSQLGIAAPPSFRVVNQSGGTSLPGSDPQQGWEGEEALDVEWAHAIAPGANIILVEANSASDNDLFAAVNWARNQAGVSVISMSWGSDDNAAYASYDQNLANTYLVTPNGHQGITFVASSGDNGVPSFPSTDPNVLAVGGTDVYLNSNGTINHETAWTPQTGGGVTWSGGGGISQEFSGRKVPDVSYNAGVAFAVYDTFGPDTGWTGVGGTSAGAPQWAALIAIADQMRVTNGLGTLNGATQTLKALYAAPAADFHDITSGSTQYQSAGVGYDLATGIGTPVANLLIPYLATYGGSGSTGGGTTTAPAAPGNFQASATSYNSASLSWSLSSGATGYYVYETVSGTTSLIATLSSTATSYSVSGLSASTPYSFKVAAFNSAGSTSTASINVTTPAAPVTVTVPANVKATATSTTVAQVSWSGVTGATGYYVYEWNGSAAVLVASVGSSTTSVSVSGQTAGATEYFYVTAYNSTSNASSGWVSVVMPTATTTAVTAPTNVTAKATSTTTGTISWTASTNATGYRIYYWNGFSSVLLGTVSSSTTSVTISGMSPGASYQFSVVAYNSTSTAASNWVTLTTPLS
jgi:subtilase family serine protease